MTSIFEYNKEEEERKLRIAERQAGYDEGYDRGIEHTLAELVNEGILSKIGRAHV